MDSSQNPNSVDQLHETGPLETLITQTQIISEQVSSQISTGEFLITQLVIIASVLLGAKYAHQVVKRQKSFETIMSSKTDQKLRDSWHLVRKIHDDPNPSIDIKMYAFNDHVNTDDAAQIRYILNYYEYMFVGVDQNILDENILFESQHSTVGTLYKQTKPFIYELRERVPQPTAYIVFEKYAIKWRNKVDNMPKPPNKT